MALTWLHVSDFHLSPLGSYDVNQVLKALVESVERFRQTTEWKPDLIFATGDIAGKGDVAIFKGGDDAPATKFFDKLLQAAGQGRERLFIVPGNHDVERDQGLVPPTFQTEVDINNYFEKSKRYHFLKLQAFSEWYNDYFEAVKPERTFPDKSTCELIPYTLRKNDDEVSLKLLLINSALFCEDASKDIGKLCIGRFCLNPLIEQLESERKKGDLSLVIAMIHHPFFVLHTLESIALKNVLSSQVDILLNGHLHQTEVNFGELVELGSGAAYFSANSSKNAMYCRFDGKKIEVYPICYYEKSSQWSDDPNVFYKTKEATRSFEILRLRNSAAPDPVVTTETNGHPENKYGTSYQEFLIAALDHVLPTAVQGFSAKVSQIFVSLSLSDTWQSEERYSPETKVYDRQKEVDGFTAEAVMRAAFKKNRLLLVIGDPGQGKTTLLQHYALSCIDKERCKDFGFPEPVMVFYLQLRDLKKGDTGYSALPVNILAWAHTVPSSEKERPENLETLIFESLCQKKSLVLLDGLDEISELEERKEVCEWIKNTITDFPKACFVVTSRPTGYRPVDDIEIQIPLKRADILDFKPVQQKTFLQNWFTEVFLSKIPTDSGDTEDPEWENRQKEKALDKASAVIKFLNKDENKSLLKLAGIPLMLQIMAMLWNEDDTLPESRATLYKKALDYLLGYQYKRRNIVPKLPEADAIGVLAPVALWMQEELKKDEADQEVMKTRMQKELNKIPKKQKPPKAKAFSDDLIDRAGLLVRYGQTDYAFRHKSFREYLTGFQLMKNPVMDLSLQKLIEHFSEPFWEEPIRFFFGQIDAESFNTFMQNFFDVVSEEVIQSKQELLQTIIEETPKEKRKIDTLCKKLLDSETTLRRQQVILDCLKTIGNPEALNTLYQFRAGKLAKNDDVADRAEEVILAFGGKALERNIEKSVSGNPLSFRNSNEENSEYILIPGGSYIYSVTEEIVSVPELYVAKYPVTNKLYRSFIAALEESVALQEELFKIALNNTEHSTVANFFKEGKNDLAALCRSTYDEDRKFSGAEQPVVGITWYAAQAYCFWLSLCAGKPDSYRLPNDIQREWAAGGKREPIPQKVREYPWSDEKGEPTPTLANFGMNVGYTTPVNRYPEGATPEGLYDMAGNVWEWCNDSVGSDRVIRGGSWNYGAVRCRSAYRNGNTPGRRRSGVGFRPVFVP
ncbi:SUMF1/EgtB/PvdO family nonheme iron enzyme [Pelodictyon phaeoclathratiforme]|jgi:formylglycine-generating enzyme required for sulfatase activity/predicted MPP superfamily phosphohydrolase|uniref:NACHT domain-containing protein n=1 Tax=Pelodictyon phaeoclathratiforme (strain DSM 5477 / BU-1) TaxID=324925 RepID=B4SEB9_PELPB|nr:SUMF1/EgtB/PvdO family nonheme iron enzyme [Pelodictyon phaeoclathratiforme]ACF44538.1 protein of unknown function DUF323 [Pelodictyon phaeoclathratiforme BU-1]MBV5290120.1 SUMF1/EgtB/PvdO family nonheme iron enzyme [Pelodictyon phaeoclathratiforme]